MITTLLLAGILAQAPVYTADSIVNTASGLAGSYAANTFVTITGQNLAHTTRAITPADIHAGVLPTVLPGTGVSVIVSGLLADIFSVSPTQVVVLVPTILTAGPGSIQLEVNGLAGPRIPITLGDSAPAMYEAGAASHGRVYVQAWHADASPVTEDSPAQIGEEIVIWATGLGPTIPAAIPNQVPLTDARLADAQHFHVTLNRLPVAARTIEFVGATKGSAGMYQIKMTIPEGAAANPEIRVGTNNGAVMVLSPPGRVLPVELQGRPIGKPIRKPPRIIMY